MSARDWENPGLPHRNRLPARARFASDRERVTSLDGMWLTARVPSPLGMDDSWMLTLPEEAVERPVPSRLEPEDRPWYTNINSPIPLDPPFVPDENEVRLYHRTFDGRPSEGERILIRFDSVDSCFEVAVNGRWIGMSKGSRLTAEFDVTEAVQSGENLLAVKVLQWSDGTHMEDQDMWRLSGIFRPVSLIERPAGGFEDLWFESDFDSETGLGAGAVRWRGEGARVRVELFDGEALIHEAAGLDSPILLDRLPVEPWSAESPRLYRLRASLEA
ncbi:MAG: hypothetical protein MH204_03150, partial [Fimbriimonadaceae bacterium]|nr:hypothetical protein [Fimbriimonadaceae bacterium]